jgi:two-component sensor histidine kinase
MSPGPYVVEDAKLDPRSLANSLVAGGPGYGFYAAAPLVTAGGYGLGTLCVIDVQSRTVDQALIDDLSDLASVVMDQLELRLSARTALDRAHLMAREIDHRVMNSLQFVSSLLAMQKPNGDRRSGCAARERGEPRLGRGAGPPQFLHRAF